MVNVSLHGGISNEDQRELAAAVAVTDRTFLLTRGSCQLN